MSDEQNKSPPHHTPEPWQYDPDSGLVHSLDGTLICDMCTDPNSDETAEHHANGFLVDCAPNLLEGAVAAVNAFDELKSDHPAKAHRLSIAIEALRDAIYLVRRGQE